MSRPSRTLSQIVSEFGDGFSSAAGIAVEDTSPLWTPLPPQPGRGIKVPDGRLLSPQQLAVDSQADELFFGGSVGGGKTAVLIGIAATQHHDSIIFRREFTQFTGPGALIAQSRELFGIHGEYNGSDHAWRGLPGGRSLQFGSVQHEKDRRKWAGRPHDLKCYDELPQIPEALYRYLNTWLRTTQHGQRCRIVGTGNPQLTEEERWVLRYWGPWLDKHHPHPASPGALRWYIVDDSGKDLEVAGPEWGSARPSPILV